MLVNRFRMDSNVLTYSLAGMGCSSSVVCVDMARHLLKALPNTVALIVNHENITENFYSGNDTSMQLANSLFRAGGAAAIVSNRQALGRCPSSLPPCSHSQLILHEYNSCGSHASCATEGPLLHCDIFKTVAAPLASHGMKTVTNWPSLIQ